MIPVRLEGFDKLIKNACARLQLRICAVFLRRYDLCWFGRKLFDARVFRSRLPVCVAFRELFVPFPLDFSELSGRIGRRLTVVFPEIKLHPISQDGTRSQ